MSAYARLAKLPPPKLAPLDVAAFVDRVATLEKAHDIQVAAGPAADDPGRRRSARAAADQPDSQRRRRGHARPAAACGSAGSASPGSSPATVELWVEDEGPGLVEHRQPVRAVLHHQAGRLRHRPGPEPADRRGPRRQPAAGEPRRPPRRAAPACGCRCSRRSRSRGRERLAVPAATVAGLKPVALCLALVPALQARLPRGNVSQMWKRLFDGQADWQYAARGADRDARARVAGRPAGAALRRRRDARGVSATRSLSTSPLVRGPLRLVGATAFLLVFAVLVFPALELAGLKPRTGVHLDTSRRAGRSISGCRCWRPS